MTDDELIAKLRNLNDDYALNTLGVREPLIDAAADRIAQLTGTDEDAE